MVKFKLVQVKWLDAQTGFSQAMPISEFKKDFKPLYNYSFGYLLEDNKDHIILGFLLMDSEIIDEETMIKHWQLIPKGMVKEVNALKEYKNELRDYPHSRSVEGVKILAQYRGLECNKKYAEAFKLIRWIK